VNAIPRRGKKGIVGGETGNPTEILGPCAADANSDAIRQPEPGSAMSWRQQAEQVQTQAQCSPEGNSMPNLRGIVQQLKTQRDRAQKEVERLNAALMALGVSGGSLGSQSGGLRRVRTVNSRKPLSAAARKRIAAAQRARWAKWKAARRSK